MKKILILLTALLVIPITVGAENTDYSTEKITNIERTNDNDNQETPTTPTTPSTGSEVVSPNPDIIDPEFGVDEFGTRILKKLYQIADLLKKIAAPVSVIMFIVGAILMVTGALGRKDGARQGIVVCILSIVTYAICMYSEPIILAVSNWLAS